MLLNYYLMKILYIIFIIINKLTSPVPPKNTGTDHGNDSYVILHQEIFHNKFLVITKLRTVNLFRGENRKRKKSHSQAQSSYKTNFLAERSIPTHTNK